MYFSSLLSVNPLECISMKNQQCKIRPEIVNINSNNPIFHPVRIKTNKCNGNCNDINDPYAKICTPDVVKYSNVKVFNLLSRTNETRHIKSHKKCNVYVDQMELFVIINNIGMKINVDVNVKNQLIKVYAIKDLFGILVIVDVNAINLVILVNIQIIQIVSAEKNQLIHQLKIALKILMRPVQLKKTLDKNETRLVKKTLDENKYRMLFWIFFIFFLISIGIRIGIGIYFVYYKYVNRNKYDLPY